MIGTFQQRPQSKRINQNIQAIRPTTRGNAKQQAEKCFKIAKQHMEKNQLEKSIQFYLQTTIHDPNYYQAYCNMGTCLRTLGSFIQAISAYLKAMSIKPDDFITNYNLANAYRIIGDQEKAVKLYKFVIKLKQQKGLQIGSIYSNSYTNLGICYKNVGNYSSAIQCYQKAQKLSPNDNSIAYNHAMCLKRVLYKLSEDQAFAKLKIQKIYKTRQLFQKVASADPNNKMAQLSLIQLKCMIDKSEQTLTQCIKQFKALAAKEGTKIQIKQQADQKIAYCLNLLKKYQQSVILYKKSLQAVESRKQSAHNIQIVQKLIELPSKKQVNKYDISQEKIQKVSTKSIVQTVTVEPQPKKVQKIKQNLVQKHLPELKRLCEDKKFNQCLQNITELQENLQKKQLLIIFFSIQTQAQQNKFAAQSAYKVYVQHFHQKQTDPIISEMFCFDTHKAMASMLTFLGKNELAIKHYEIISQFISKSKDNQEANLTQIHSGLGVNYQSQGLHEKAVEEFKKALKLQPNNINLLYNLGFCYQSAGQNKQAVQIYNNFLQKMSSQQGIQPQVRKGYIIDCMINIAYCSQGFEQELQAYQKTIQQMGQYYNNESAKIIQILDQSIIMNFYLKIANLYEDRIQKQIKSSRAQNNQQNIKIYKQKLLKIFLILLDFKNCPDRQQILINCGNIFYEEREYLNSLNFYQRLNKYKNLVSNNVALALFNLNQYERALTNMIYATECEPQNYIYKINFTIMCWILGIQNILSAETIEKKFGCRCQTQFNSRLQLGKGLIAKITNRIIAMMRKNDYEYNNNLVNELNVKQTISDLLDETEKDSDWMENQSKTKHQYLYRYFKEHMSKGHSTQPKNFVFNQILTIALKKYSKESQVKQNLKFLLNKLQSLDESQKKMSITQFCISFFVYLNSEHSKEIQQIFKSYIGIQNVSSINFKDQQYPLDDGYPLKQYKIQYPTQIKLKNIIHSLIQWETSLQDNVVFVLKVVQSLAYKKNISGPLAIDYKFPHCKSIETCQECLKKTILVCAKMLRVVPQIQCQKQIKQFSQYKTKLAHQYELKFNQTAKNSVKDNLLKYQLSKDLLPMHIRISFNTFSCCAQFLNELCTTYNADSVKIVESQTKQVSLVINKLVKVRCSWKQSNIVKQYVLKYFNYPLSIKGLSALYLDVDIIWIKQIDKQIKQLLEPFIHLFSEQGRAKQ